MKKDKLGTYAPNTWCPGCGSFAILQAFKNVLLELRKEGTSLSDVAIISGVGCHAKIVDYVGVNSFYSLHGRPIPAAEGIKLANPKLKVIVFAGDGDSYGEGLEHFIFAAKRNIDITVIIHNNQVYSLTTGQFSPTSPLGFPGKSTPHGSIEKPFNPLELAYASGATFIARGYTNNLKLLEKIIKKGIKHKGFSHIDVLQICATFFDRHDYYGNHVYELKKHNPSEPKKAYKKITEWDYNSDAPISLGVLYKENVRTYDQRLLSSVVKSINIDKKIKNKFRDFI